MAGKEEVLGRKRIEAEKGGQRGERRRERGGGEREL